MKKYWENKTVRYYILGVAGILAIALAVWLVMRPKPLANYPDFVDKFNRIVESGGTKYHISDYDVEGHKSFGGDGGRLTVQVSHGKLMKVSITNASESSNMDSFVVCAAASAKALGVSSDAVLGLVDQSIRTRKNKEITDGNFEIKTESVFSTSFDLISVTITHK